MNTVSHNKIGKIGFAIAVAPWLAYTLTMVCAVARLPGFS